MTTFPLAKEPQVALLVVSIVFAVLNVPIVALRFAARKRAWGHFGWSDAALLAALITTTALCGTIAAACLVAGVGWHAVEAIVSHGLGFLTQQGQMILAITQLWAVSVLLCKLSILILLGDLFSAVRYLHMSTRVLGVVAVLLWMAQFIGGLTVCVPIDNWWSIPAIVGWCGWKQKKLFVSTSILHTITDFAILLLPAPCLWSLQLPFKTRLGLIFVFCGGLFATVISIGRIISLDRLQWTDVTYSEWEALLFSVIEPSMGIWIACIPHIRSLFKRKAPRGGSARMSSNSKLASTARPSVATTGEPVSPTSPTAL